MKTVIYGLARSGTTALFYKIRESLPADTICLFEPARFDPRIIRKNRDMSGREPFVLAKILPFRPFNPSAAESFAHFEKQILIVRDPRDRLISRLLYGVYSCNFFDDNHKLGRFLQLLKHKESDPHSVSMKKLLTTFSELDGERSSFADWASHYQDHSIRKPIEFHLQHEGLFLFRYEDMIDERLDSLGRYLGVSLNAATSVPRELSRVPRTKNYGGWRDWFTPDDIEDLCPILQPFMDRYYPTSDWELSLSPTIPAEHGSSYIRRIANERRAAMKLPLIGEEASQSV